MSNSTTTATLDLSPYFDNPSVESATQLASLINKRLPTQDLSKQDTTSLETLITSIIQHTLALSYAHRENIDEYIILLSYTALQINSAPTPLGHIGEDPRPQDPIATLRPADGPAILGERLSRVLSDSISSTAPHDPQHSKQYYSQLSVHATILARAFALGEEAFRRSLWQDIESLLANTLLSSAEQNPGVFVALAALLLGAGKDIEEYMGGKKFMRSKARIGHDGAGALGEDTNQWGWGDFVQVLMDQHEVKTMGQLPEYIKESFDLAKKHVGLGAGVSENWDSQRLAREAFGWVSS